MVEYLDEVIGGVLAKLDRGGQRDDTLVLFMSDHGEMLGDRGLLAEGLPLLRRTGTRTALALVAAQPAERRGI